ncbi:alkaline phosphatase family protein [Edaphobacter bradus]|uniref:alkaline phosphatase family protein n=1 Tax=Edaphobacter bradus TaxID=2259016 RepID=UPI0021E066C5|nr:alkaline phosphatase family protein [Edaphobacter bradus]
MRKYIALLLLMVLLVPAVPAAHADEYHAKPKLVIILVIDQFRGDYLERYRDDLKAANGFNLFLKRGAYFGSCYYDYANTKTAPGHATIGTGAYTDGHGIGSNEWWDLSRNTDRPISSVEDERYRIVGTFDDLPALLPPPAPKPTDARIGASPLNLRATTLGDEVRLATHGEAKVYGISLKDRAAILPAGQTANAAFWIDNATGRFVTSTYYMSKLPDWVTKFNKGPRQAQAVKEAGLEETTQFFAMVGRTPAANSYELDFAKTLIDNEQMGQHGVTDVLTVSLSANDIMGHQMGPDSDAEKEMVIGLDRDLDSFFGYLDKKIGLENVMIALTADHGVAPIPAESARLGVASARIDLENLTAAINEELNAKFSPGKSVPYFLPMQELPYLALDPRAFGTVSEKDAEQAVAAAIPVAVRKLGAPTLPPNNNDTLEATRRYEESRVAADPAFAFVRSRVDLAAGKIPRTEFGGLIEHSYSDHGGWYVMAVPTAYQMEYMNGSQTTHFSPWSYDRHVPLAFFGAEFAPGFYRERVAPVDIAATFASILGVNAPSANVGHVLTEALRPVEAGK